MSAAYPKFKQACLSISAAGISAYDLATATVKLILLSSAYNYSSSHQFLSDVNANRVGTDQTTTVTSTANGTLKFTVPNFSIASATVKGVAAYVDTGTAGTSPLIGFFDGVFSVTTSQATTTGATTIPVDPLPYALASGATLTFGAVTVTLSGAAAQGARSISVSATSGNIAANVTATNGVISGCNLPYTASSTVTFTVTPDATNGFLTI